MGDRQVRKEDVRSRGKREEQCHRYFPFACEELVDAEGREGAPLRLVAPVLLSRGFFAADVASVDDARGAPSFMTIFAWISSNLPALTFLGQNNVTNLTRGIEYDVEKLVKIMNSRPEVSSPPVPVFASCRLLLQDDLYALADGSERLFEHGDLVFSWHVAARELQLFLKRDQ